MSKACIFEKIVSGQTKCSVPWELPFQSPLSHHCCHTGFFLDVWKVMYWQRCVPQKIRHNSVGKSPCTDTGSWTGTPWIEIKLKENNVHAQCFMTANVMQQNSNSTDIHKACYMHTHLWPHTNWNNNHPLQKHNSTCIEPQYSLAKTQYTPRQSNPSLQGPEPCLSAPKTHKLWCQLRLEAQILCCSVTPPALRTQWILSWTSTDTYSKLYSREL